VARGGSHVWRELREELGGLGSAEWGREETSGGQATLEEAGERICRGGWPWRKPSRELGGAGGSEGSQGRGSGG
jgi:hypothetical protein